MALAPLFPEEIQFQAKNGRNLTAGWLNVYLAGTDDVAETFCDYGVTRNPQDIVLDDNGRAVVICESGVAYRLEVFDSEGTLLWTEEPIFCEGTGSGGSGDVEVESTDGSIYVSKTVAAGKTTFDLSTNTGDVPEMAEWGRFRAPAVSTPGALQLARVDGNIDLDTGVQLVAGNHYHVTTEIVVTPDGTGINYRTVTFELQDLDGNTLASRTDSVDTSTSEPVTPELSVDLYPTVDVEVVPVVYWDDDIASVEVPRMDVHRFYAGFRAVPNTVATKDWVNGNFLPSEFSGDVIPWSALEGTAGTITGISGSAVGTDYSAVSSIASSYAESAASGKLDSSAFSSYTATALSGIQQDTATISSYVSGLSSKVDQSAFDDCCSAMSAAVSSVSSDVSSLSATVSGLTGTYLEQSAFTAYTSTALTGLQQDTADISAAISAITGQTGSYIPWSASGEFQPSGNYVDQSAFDDCCSAMSAAVSSKAESSSLSSYQLTADMSGYIPTSESANYQQVSAMSAYQPSGDYAYNSAVSGKLDASAQVVTATAGDGTYVTSINGMGISGQGGSTGDYVEKSALEVVIGSDNTAELYALAQGSANSASAVSFVQGLYNSAKQGSLAQGQGNMAYTHAFVQGITNSAGIYSLAQGITNSAYAESLAQGNGNSAVSGSLAQGSKNVASADSFAQGYHNTAMSVSFAQGFYTTAKQTAAVFGQFNLRGDGDTLSGDSAAFAIGDGTASGARHDLMLVTKDGEITMYSSTADTAGTGIMSSIRALSASASGFATTAYVDSAVSGVEITFDSSITTASGTSGITAGVNTAILSGYQLTADMSGYIPTSESANYQQASAMTAYQLSGDYAYHSALSAYQEVSGMTAYQPSGDYIYASALGTGVI